MNESLDLRKPGSAPRGYWGMVWRQFRRSRTSMLGLAFVGMMFAVAFFAPFLAEKKPLLWIQNGETTFPLIREFFAPSEAPEVVLEKSYDYLLLFLPSAFLICWLAGKYQVRKLYKWLLLLFAGLLLLLPFKVVQSRLDATPYRQLAAAGKGEGIFPLIPYGPFEQGFGNRIPPTWWQGRRAAGENSTYHALGTDNAGRDVLVRIIHGARVSLAVGIVSVLVATAIGIFIGAIAGYFGGKADILLSRAIEIVMCFPTFFLILTIIAIMDERSILNIVLVIGCTSWTGIARLVRGEVLKQRGLDYVTAAIALGASSLRTIFRHLLPNSVAPVLVSMTFGIASSILMESGLSFLGFGVDIPTASWGELLNQAREAPMVYWWLAVFPGLPIFFTVTIYNLVGEGLRDAMDPKLRLPG